MSKYCFAFLLISLLSITQQQAQTTFRLSYDIASFDIAGGMVESPLGGYTMAGTNTSLIPLYGNVVHFDSAGTIVWANSYTGGVATDFSDIKNVSTGGYIVCGSSSDGGAILVRLSATGNVTWAKTYECPDMSGKSSNESAYAVIETSDGGFAVAGGVDYFWDGVSGSTIDTTSALGFKVDANGTLEWSRIWTISTANPDEHYFNDVAETANGFVFVGVSSEGSGTLNDDGDYPRNALLVKTSSTGVSQYIHRWGSGNSNSEGLNCALTLSNGHVLTGGYDNSDAFLLRIDGTSASATKQWGFSIKGSGLPPVNFLIQDIMQNSNGDYSFIGTRIDALSFAFDSYVAKVNPGTSTLSLIKGYAPIGLSSILPEGGITNDQGYFMVMTDQQTSGFNYNVIRTDAQGEIGSANSGCTFTSFTPSTSDYDPSFQAVTNTQYTSISESGFSPTVTPLSPSPVVHCLVTTCTPPSAATTVTADPATICAGASSSITASGAGSGVVYNVYDAATGGTFLGSTPLSVSPASTATYYVETANATDPNCVSITRVAVTVTVISAPTATAGANGPLCVGNTLNLTSTGGSGYTWAGPNGFGSSTQNPSLTNVTTTESGTYSVTVTNGSCTDTASVAVSVVNAPAADITGEGSICLGASDTLTATGGGSYLWSTSETTATIIVNPASDATYTVTVTVGSCTANTSATVTVTSNPTATIGGNSPVCEGETVNLTASGGATYAWTGPNGFTDGTQNPSITGISNTGSGTYTVVVTQNGCTDTATTDITVNPMPSAQISGNLVLCTGSSDTLFASGGTAYSWNDGSTNDTLIISPTSDAIFTVTVTDNGCIDTTSTAVSVVGNPIITIAYNNPVCQGDTILFSAGGANNYTWTGQAGFTSSLQNPSIYPVSSANSGWYYVTGMVGSCQGEDSIQVLVQDIPLATILGDDTLCAGESTTLTATGGNSYIWNNGSTTTTISVQPAADSTYQVIANLNGCLDTAQLTLTVLALPIASATVITPVCAGDTLFFTGSGGGSYAWTGPAGYTDNTQSPIIANTQTTQSGTYNLTVTDANGCSATTSTSATINAKPNATITGDTTVCEGDQTTLTASGGFLYAWSNGAITSSAIITPSGDSTLTVIVSTGNCSDTAIVNVQLNPNPSATVSGDTQICQGESTTLTAAGGTSYAWSSGGSGSQTVVTPPLSGIATIIVTVTDINSCTDTAKINISIDQAPVAGISGILAICSGESTTLLGSGTGTYLWSTSETTTAITVSPLSNSSYQLTVTSANGCTDSASTQVDVTQKPTAMITGDSAVCPGNSITLQASVGTTYAWNTGSSNSSITLSPSASGVYMVTVSNGNCTDTASYSVIVYPETIAIAGSDTTINQTEEAQLTATGGTDYYWYPSAGLSCIDCPNPTAKPDTTTNYCVVVTSTSSCVDTACVLVNFKYKCGELFVPTIFSPNEDGKNDTLFVMGNCIETLNFVVFDRWGEKVFETTDPLIGWDGKFNGQIMNTATYIYKLDAVLKDDEVIQQNGNFTLVK